MKQLCKCSLKLALVAGLIFNGAVAGYLDLTDDSTISALLASPITNGFRGSIDGVGFNLTSTDGQVNFKADGKYDGSKNLGCQVGGGPLKCDKDGAGIGNDEISGLTASSRQTLNLDFDRAVSISSFDFLDLYDNSGNSKGTEQASVFIDGVLYQLDALGASGDGGYARLDLLSLGGPILGKNIQFTAYQGLAIQDDSDNDYAFAAVTVSAVPVPAALWLFGSGLVALFGFSKRKSRVTS